MAMTTSGSPLYFVGVGSTAQENLHGPPPQEGGESRQPSVAGRPSRPPRSPTARQSKRHKWRCRQELRLAEQIWVTNGLVLCPMALSTSLDLSLVSLVLALVALVLSLVALVFVLGLTMVSLVLPVALSCVPWPWLCPMVLYVRSTLRRKQ